jgi:hypothetical protein
MLGQVQRGTDAGGHRLIAPTGWRRQETP